MRRDDALGRSGPQIFRPRRARQRHPALRHLAALRLHRHHAVRRHRRGDCRAGSRRASCSAWCSCSRASPSRSPRCRSTCGRPTSMRARRPRLPPSSPGAEGGGDGAARRVAIDALGPPTDDWRQIVVFAALASIVLGASARSDRRTSSGCSPIRSINNVGFILIGLAAGTPAGVASVLLYLAIYVAMTLGSFLVVLQMRDEDGEPVETIAALSGLSRSRPGLAAGDGDVHVQPRRHPAAVRLLAKFVVFQAAVQADLAARRGWHRRLGDRRLLLYQDRQDDVFRRARAAFQRSRDWIEEPADRRPARSSFRRLAICYWARWTPPPNVPRARSSFNSHASANRIHQ